MKTYKIVKQCVGTKYAIFYSFPNGIKEMENLIALLTVFISTEIIEKLIADIPDDLTYDRREGIWHEIGGSKQVKQQLKNKWL
jgi:hypothetical protein